jgi:hypothetical protein
MTRNQGLALASEVFLKIAATTQMKTSLFNEFKLLNMSLNNGGGIIEDIASWGPSRHWTYIFKAVTEKTSASQKEKVGIVDVLHWFNTHNMDENGQIDR